MNCLLRIHVKATTDTTEQTELLVRGICRRLETEDGVGYRFDYRSVDAEDPAAVTREQITVTPAGAKLIRTGSIQSVMEIVPDELRKCDYGTPFGTLVFDILGIGVDISSDPQNTAVSFSYELQHDGEMISSHEVEIAVEHTEE
ncbi:MAG: DUF1934 domain-containing protein [Lachnospiraceae bacterium]|nr:DUF1934 domain-containing protein [Lachnospiraceae bacterium]